MREAIIADLSTKIPPALALELVESYGQLVSKHRRGELEEALLKAGRFVEQILRAIEHIRTGITPAEIKQAKATVHAIGNDTNLPDPLRFLIPQVAYGIYNLRSKRNAIHVKEIDPTAIDVAMTVSAAGWILAEFIRLYHRPEATAVAGAMLALTRGTIPLVESINGEIFVGKSVPARFELLLLLAHAMPKGMSRNALGSAAKCSQPSVSTAIKFLSLARMVHLGTDKSYYITASGEQTLSQWLVKGDG